MHNSDSDVELEAVLSSLRQLRLQKNDKETVRRTLLLKMEEMPVTAVREEAEDRQLEHMDTLTASFLADCKTLSLAETDVFEVKTSLQSFMQAKPRSANAPVISFLSVLSTVSLDVAEKQLVRDDLVAVMQGAVAQAVTRSEEHREGSFVSLFSSMLGGRSVLAFA